MHEVVVSEAEILSVSTANVDGEFRLIFSMRLDKEDSFFVTNIALSADNSARLFSDIINMSNFNDKVKELLIKKEKENDSIVDLIT